MVGRLVKHEEVVGDHDEDCQSHPCLLSPRENADFAERLRPCQPQGSLHPHFRPTKAFNESIQRKDSTKAFNKSIQRKHSTKADSKSVPRKHSTKVFIESNQPKRSMKAFLESNQPKHSSVINTALGLPCVCRRHQRMPDVHIENRPLNECDIVHCL